MQQKNKIQFIHSAYNNNQEQFTKVCSKRSNPQYILKPPL